MAVKRKLVGLNAYIYTFGRNDRDTYYRYMERLKKKGTVTEIFVNNKYGFEYRKSIQL